jgi:hypothetical protein
MQRVHFLPGDLTSTVKLLDLNGQALVEASAGDVVAFSVADSLPKVSPLCFSFCTSRVRLCQSVYTQKYVYTYVRMYTAYVQSGNSAVYVSQIVSRTTYTLSHARHTYAYTPSSVRKTRRP